MTWEFNILYFLQGLHNPILDKLMVITTTMGDAGLIWILFAVVFLFTKRYRKCGVNMLLALMVMIVFGNIILKNIFMRERPCWIDESVELLVKSPHDYSFPSGHTYASIAAATAILLRHKWEGIIATVAAILISFSRLYLFVHFPTDVLVSCILGVATAWITYYFVEKCFDRISQKFLERRWTKTCQQKS